MATAVEAADLGPGWNSPASYETTTGPYNWSGLYTGAFAGGAHSMWTIDFYRNNNHGHADISSDGFAFGAYAGYNWQVSRNWVLGVEGDIGWANASQSIEVFDNDRTDTRIDMFGSVRARVGYALDRLLIFGTAGFGFADISQNIQKGRNAGEQVVWENQSPVGYVIGGGLDYAFTNNWIGRAEYLYANYGDVSLTNADGNKAIFANDMHLVRVGLAYKF